MTFHDIATDNDCVDDVQMQLDNGDRICTCGVDCFETDYEISLSSSAWPAKKFAVSKMT